MARVVLAMSGGVDSSVAAHLLLSAGHDVLGVFMRHGEKSAEVCAVPAGGAADGSGGFGDKMARGGNDRRTSLPVMGTRQDHKQGCCTASDAADARRVAAAMGIPFYALDLQSDFARIVDYFVDDYLSGRTPNPCVRCNHWIKFGRLFDYADDVDADYVATGHYARKDGAWELHRGRDNSKDQSYALFGIRRDRLDRMLLPVGGYTKVEIREIAKSLNLGVANKKDSQEICFVTQGHHSDFVRSKDPVRAAKTAGEFVLSDGTVVGRHDGYEAFTVGQRKGLGIALGKPAFVLRVEPDSQRVVLGERHDLLEREFDADDANWLIDPDDLRNPSGRISVQIRYNGAPHDAQVTLDPTDPTRFHCRFEAPQSSIAPGQAAVVFDGSRVLGGGWICSR